MAGTPLTRQERSSDRRNNEVLGGAHQTCRHLDDDAVDIWHVNACLNDAGGHQDIIPMLKLRVAATSRTQSVHTA